jgi:hypothetical protein
MLAGSGQGRPFTTERGTTGHSRRHRQELGYGIAGNGYQRGHTSNPITVNSSVWIDGRVRVGIKNKLWLIIDAYGNALATGTEPGDTELRISFTTSVESKETNLLNELAMLLELYELYSDTDAQYAYQLQIDR